MERYSLEPKVVNKFDGIYRFLSNFHDVYQHTGRYIEWDGFNFPTVEHAYQAAKTRKFDEQQEILNCQTPGQAKRLGKRVTLRPDWEEKKLMIMEQLLRQKFNLPYYESRLLSTGSAELIEGNEWGDCFWGVYFGRGLNHLGKLLMKIREERKRQYATNS